MRCFIGLKEVMKANLRKIFKFLIALSVVFATVGVVFHHSHAQTDKNHHEDTCEICAVYQVLSSGVVPTQVIPLLVLVFILIPRVNAIIPQLHSTDLSFTHSGLDPPTYSFN